MILLCRVNRCLIAILLDGITISGINADITLRYVAVRIFHCVSVFGS